MLILLVPVITLILAPIHPTITITLALTPITTLTWEVLFKCERLYVGVTFEFLEAKVVINYERDLNAKVLINYERDLNAKVVINYARDQGT